MSRKKGHEEAETLFDRIVGIVSETQDMLVIFFALTRVVALAIANATDTKEQGRQAIDLFASQVWEILPLMRQEVDIARAEDAASPPGRPN